MTIRNCLEFGTWNLIINKLLWVGGDEAVFFGGGNDFHGDVVLAGEEESLTHLGSQEKVTLTLGEEKGGR